MEKKQTAVQWLIEQIKQTVSMSDKVYELEKQALQMEREQIEEAVKICVLEDRKLLRQSNLFCQLILPRPKLPSEYYTQTFKP